MSISYNPETDPRFFHLYDDQMVNLLDTHGFPVIPEQPKDVHKLGRGLGETLNYYSDQSKQLFIQGRLYTAVGSDLDNFGQQFGVNRLSGEDDDTYRLHLQAVFSPKKVTKLNIENSINSFIITNPPVSLFLPWKQVLHFDNVEVYDHGYIDVGDSYMWSPDYWRSGILVVKSGLSSQLQGIVNSLVAIGVLVIYDQFDFSLCSEDGLTLDNRGHQNFNTAQLTPVDDGMFFDLVIPGTFDALKYQLDVTPFFIGLACQNFQSYIRSVVDLRICPTIIPSVIWETQGTVWEDLTSSWGTFVTSSTNPWENVTTPWENFIDPPYPNLYSWSTVTTPWENFNVGGWETLSYTQSNGTSTGCTDIAISTKSYSTTTSLVFSIISGEQYKYSELLVFAESLSLNDSYTDFFQGITALTLNDSIAFSDRASTEYPEARSDIFTLTDNTVSDKSPYHLFDNITLSDGENLDNS